MHQKTQKQIDKAHEHRETWIKANFENVDPKFHKKMKEKEKLSPLKCEKCLNEAQDRNFERNKTQAVVQNIQDIDSAILDTMSSEDAEIVQQL